MLNSRLSIAAVIAAIVVTAFFDRYLMAVAHLQGGWIFALPLAPGSAISIFGLLENTSGVVLSAVMNAAYYYGLLLLVRRWRRGAGAAEEKR